MKISAIRLVTLAWENSILDNQKFRYIMRQSSLNSSSSFSDEKREVP